MTTPTDPNPEQVQARLAHLNIVQLNISRMAGYSANLKTLTLTITAALVAVAFDRELPILFWAGFFVVGAFGLLDAYYLSLEKKFRQLYNEIVSREWSLAFDLTIKPSSSRPADVLMAASSVSVWVFYGVLLASFAGLPHVQRNVQPDAPSEQISQTSRLDEPTPVAGSAQLDDGSRSDPDKRANAEREPVSGNVEPNP